MDNQALINASEKTDQSIASRPGSRTSNHTSGSQGSDSQSGESDNGDMTCVADFNFEFREVNVEARLAQFLRIMCETVPAIPGYKGYEHKVIHWIQYQLPNDATLWNELEKVLLPFWEGCADGSIIEDSPEHIAANGLVMDMLDEASGKIDWDAYKVPPGEEVSPDQH